MAAGQKMFSRRQACRLNTFHVLTVTDHGVHRCLAPPRAVIRWWRRLIRIIRRARKEAMTVQALTQELEAALAELPMFDAHTHLVGGRLGARGLHDILLYHMVVSDLYAAGCPSGARLTQYPGWPDPSEAHARLAEAVPYLSHIRNTSCFWMLRAILRDLYGWEEPVTADNWRRLDAMIRERADDRGWHYSILDRLNIRRTCTEFARREGGSDQERLQYSLEWAFFTRCQWGEFDTALYELEHCWGRQPESPSPIGGRRPPTERTIRSLDDLHAALAHYVDAIPYGEILSTATGFSTDIDYRLVGDDEMAAAIERRDRAGAAERDTYASYVNEAFLTALEARPERLVFQFSVGAEPLPCETGSILRQRTIKQLGDMISRHPRLPVPVLPRHRHANQAFCTPGAGIAESQPGRLLVAQLLSRRGPPGDGRTLGDAAAEQAGRIFFRRLLRPVDVRQGAPGAQAAGSGLGRQDPAGLVHAGRRPVDCRDHLVRHAADLARHGPLPISRSKMWHSRPRLCSTQHGVARASCPCLVQHWRNVGGFPLFSSPGVNAWTREKGHEGNTQFAISIINLWTTGDTPVPPNHIPADGLLFGRIITDDPHRSRRERLDDHGVLAGFQVAGDVQSRRPPDHAAGIDAVQVDGRGIVGQAVHFQADAAFCQIHVGGNDKTPTQRIGGGHRA